MTHPHPVRAAVAFLADHGNAERFLAVHRPDMLGCCTGCLTSPRTVWPCTVAGWAEEAVALRAREADRAMRALIPTQRAAAPSRARTEPLHAGGAA